MPRVLLVEDDETLAYGIATLLQLEGFAVNVLAEGRGVVGMVAHAHPDALVIDVSLPDIDGVVVADAVRKGWPKLPIIFITGHDLTGDEVRRRPATLER